MIAEHAVSCSLTLSSAEPAAAVKVPPVMDDFGDTGGFGDGFGGGSVFMNGGHPTLNLADPSLDQEATECDTQDHATSAGGRSHTSSAAAYYESQTASIELASPEGPQAPLSPLQALQQRYWDRHKKASEQEGSERWVFPSPVFDEEAFRVRVQVGA